MGEGGLVTSGTREREPERVLRLPTSTTGTGTVTHQNNGYKNQNENYSDNQQIFDHVNHPNLSLTFKNRKATWFVSSSFV